MEDELEISSVAFEHNGNIPAKYTADGSNVNPPLVFDNVSEDAESLALIVDDPDAATDPNGPSKIYDHWVVFNISPDTAEIKENSVPEGAVQGRNSSGSNKYIGPAPPTGTHRYFFRLYELSDRLSLDQSATKEDVQIALEPLLINKAELIGKYRHSQ